MSHERIYCYKMMPFGLKNVIATFQNLVNKIFLGLMGKLQKLTCFDNMIGKRRITSDHPTNLAKVFRILWRHKMKLNPDKCIFSVSSGSSSDL